MRPAVLDLGVPTLASATTLAALAKARAAGHGNQKSDCKNILHGFEDQQSALPLERLAQQCDCYIDEGLHRAQQHHAQHTDGDHHLLG